MTTADVISTMVDLIVEQFQPLRIFLFGSQARGDATESSDIDLLVILNDVPDNRKAAIEMLILLKDMPISKDIIVSTPEEVERLRDVVGTIPYTVLREGKIVYEQH
ncbi:MAG: nucleotidyltransferase domain-containing protein [Thaumarchaeota archaeon]|nr:nucleotidyltransferase domain-containing protein [Nitrososphaerota archaeon]